MAAYNTRYTYVPKGDIILAQCGDFILVHKTSLIGLIINLGERLRGRGYCWSHAAFCITPGFIMEAEWNGVKCDSIRKYQDTEYLIVHTNETDMRDENDFTQAITYVNSQQGKPYGWLTLIGTVTRFLLPTHSFFFATRANICSGLVAQALIRGWANFDVNVVSIAPSELAEAYNVPDNPKDAENGKN